jgi:hypothetical protein
MLTFSCFSQRTTDSLEIARKERRLKHEDHRRAEIGADYRNCLKLTGTITDGLTTFMPESGTSIAIFEVSYSDSVTYRGQKVIVVIPGRHSRKLKKNSLYEFSVVNYAGSEREDFDWSEYRHSGYKKKYLIDDKNSVRKIDK